MPDFTPIKRCRKCGRDFPATLEYFHSKGTPRHGLRAICRNCILGHEVGPRYLDASPDGYKRCRVCGETLPLTAFQNGYAKCRACYSRHTGHQPKARAVLSNGMKRCTKCGEIKPSTLEYFYVEKRSLSGLRAACKDCVDISSRAYEVMHREQVRAYHRVYVNGHPRKKTFNPENKRLSIQRARKNNPAVYLAAAHRRLARKRGLPDTFTTADWQRALDYFNGSCAICGRPPGLWHTIAADHWIPLSSPDCPGTIPTNIVPLCHGVGGCNNSKCNQEPLEWLRHKFGKRKAKQIVKRVAAYFEWVKSQ